MLTQQILTYIVGILSVTGFVFGIWFKVHNPQEELGKKQAVSQAQIDGKSSQLALQVQWEKEANAKRFEELNESMNVALTLAQNHIHTIDSKTDELSNKVNLMEINITRELTKINVLLDERLPRK